MLDALASSLDRTVELEELNSDLRKKSEIRISSLKLVFKQDLLGATSYLEDWNRAVEGVKKRFEIDSEEKDLVV